MEHTKNPGSTPAPNDTVNAAAGTMAPATAGGTCLQATGKLPFQLTNDYLFRALLQKSNRVLKHLTCALMHLHPEEVESVTVENPIVLGEAIESKEFILDVKVALNKKEILNYEMQVVRQEGWTSRSLVYLCREFDQLQHGEEYESIRPVTHIGFLDFTLFKEVPEFYATHKMLNIKNHHVYNDKFTLSVVDLSQINLATEEDRAWGIDHWASLFKATTWEEMKHMAERDEVMQEAADTVFYLTQDDKVRAQCWAREDYQRTMKTFEHVIRDLKETNAQQAAALEQKDAALERQAAELEYSRYIARLFRDGRTDNEAKAELMKRFGLTEEQAAEKLSAFL